jgi:hypothetical protein
MPRHHTARNRQHGTQLTARRERYASYNQNSNTQSHDVSMKTRRGEGARMGNKRRWRQKGGGRKKGTDGQTAERNAVRAPERTPLTHQPTNPPTKVRPPPSPPPPSGDRFKDRPEHPEALTFITHHRITQHHATPALSRGGISFDIPSVACKDALLSESTLRERSDPRSRVVTGCGKPYVVWRDVESTYGFSM